MLSRTTEQKSAHRRRASSVSKALSQIPLNYGSESSYANRRPSGSTSRPPRKRKGDGLPDMYQSRGLWQDIKTGRWMLVPSSSFTIMLVPPIAYAVHRVMEEYGMMDDGAVNLAERLILPSGQLEDERFGKSRWDFAFLAYYIVVWSFMRQFMTLHVFRPMAKALGIKGGKVMRFTEQGYAAFYFGIMGVCGIYVMRGLPFYWYETKYFWIDYPHRAMTWELKTYYLVQAAYWLQQSIILAAGIEKRRKDFNELVAHHLVTLWLIWWSYIFYFTYIGVSIFVTMDVSDIFLAISKCVNYASDFWSVPLFAWFVVVWTYLRHYLNIKMLYSVAFDYDHYVPASEQCCFAPLQDRWTDTFTKPFVFISILLLQLINLFWYVAIWRIMFKAVFKKEVRDDRSDDEDEDEGEGEGERREGEGVKEE